MSSHTRDIGCQVGHSLDTNDMKVSSLRAVYNFGIHAFAVSPVICLDCKFVITSILVLYRTYSVNSIIFVISCRERVGATSCASGFVDVIRQPW